MTMTIKEDPMSMAEAYEVSKRPAGRVKDDDHRVLWFWRGTYFIWNNGVYEEWDDKRIRNDVYRFLRGKTIEGKKESYVCNPDMALVSKVVDALDAVCEIPGEKQPCWIGPQIIHPNDVMAFENGILDVGQFINEGDATLIPLTPSWFSIHKFPYKFVPGLDCPQWIKFLNETLSDQECVDLLQEWFGYCLTPDTSHQKFMMLIGRPRSGKSIIGKVLKALVGVPYCASPTLRSLTGQFGLNPLLGKHLAVFADGHLSRDTDSVAVVEVFKQIVGNDPVDIHRKFLPTLSGITLPTRFMVICNEIPDMADSSQGLVSRILAVRFRRTWEGKEDISLESKLMQELGGIMLWAMEGLARLREQGRFLMGSDSKSLVEEISYSTSPVRMFIREECYTRETCPAERNPDSLQCGSMELWERWKQWATAAGHNCGTRMGLGRRIKALIPDLERLRSRIGGGRNYLYAGIELRDSLGV